MGLTRQPTARRPGSPWKQAARAAVKSLALHAGYEIRRHRPVEVRRAAIIRDERITVVLDVGANVGQYAEALRRGGYDGRIISFEPVTEAHTELERKAARDRLWECHRLALSDFDGKASIHLAGDYSSLLDMESEFAASTFESLPDGTESVTTSRLDSLQLPIDDSDHVMLKLDVQGYELHALRGAEESLRRIRAIESELSVVRLYKDQPVIRDILDYLAERGFELVNLEPAWVEPKLGRILQFDGIFRRVLDVA